MLSLIHLSHHMSLNASGPLFMDQLSLELGFVEDEAAGDGFLNVDQLSLELSFTEEEESPNSSSFVNIDQLSLELAFHEVEESIVPYEPT